MPLLHILVIGAVGFVAAIFGAITGGNSLLTVPVLVLFGLPPTRAIATTMVAVTCLSLTAGLRFYQGGIIPRRPTLGLLLSSVPGGIAGAFVALHLPPTALRLTISLAMLGMVLFLALQPRFGEEGRPTSRARRALGYALMAIWAVYGGLFSGGYTTVLTFFCVALFGTTFVQAVGLSKLVNLANSFAATAIFIAEGQVDWPIAIVLSTAMAIGGYLGAHLALRGSARFVRQVFVVAVALLGVKLLWDAVR